MRFYFNLIGVLDVSILTTLDSALKAMEEANTVGIIVRQRTSKRTFWVKVTETGVSMREQTPA